MLEAVFFVARIIAVTLAVMTLTCIAVCLAVYSSRPAENGDRMFPDGVVHNFGKVPRGIQARHAFRIVNTSDVPLRIASMRIS
jgi:hypothetical protein